MQEAAKDLVNAEEDDTGEEHGGERRKEDDMGEEGGPALTDEDCGKEEGEEEEEGEAVVTAEEGAGEEAWVGCMGDPL